MLLDNKPTSSIYYFANLTSSVSHTSVNLLHLKEKKCQRKVVSVTCIIEPMVIITLGNICFLGAVTDNQCHIFHCPLRFLCKWKDAIRKQAFKTIKNKTNYFEIFFKNLNMRGKRGLRPAGHRTAGTQPGYAGLTRQWRAGSPGSPCTAGLFGDAVKRSAGAALYSSCTMVLIHWSHQFHIVLSARSRSW